MALRKEFIQQSKEEDHEKFTQHSKEEDQGGLAARRQRATLTVQNRCQHRMMVGTDAAQQRQSPNSGAAAAAATVAAATVGAAAEVPQEVAVCLE